MFVCACVCIYSCSLTEIDVTANCVVVSCFESNAIRRLLLLFFHVVFSPAFASRSLLSITKSVYVNPHIFKFNNSAKTTHERAHSFCRCFCCCCFYCLRFVSSSVRFSIEANSLLSSIFLVLYYYDIDRVDVFRIATVAFQRIKPSLFALTSHLSIDKIDIRRYKSLYKMKHFSTPVATFIRYKWSMHQTFF